MFNKHDFLDNIFRTWPTQNPKIHNGPAGVMSAVASSSSKAVQYSCVAQGSGDMGRDKSRTKQNRLLRQRAPGQNANKKFNKHAHDRRHHTQCARRNLQPPCQDGDRVALDQAMSLAAPCKEALPLDDAPSVLTPEATSLHSCGCGASMLMAGSLE